MRHTDDETRRHGARVDLMDFFHSALLFLFLFFFSFGGVVWVGFHLIGVGYRLLEWNPYFLGFTSSLIKQSLLDWWAVFCFFGLRLGLGIIYQFDWQKGGMRSKC